MQAHAAQSLATRQLLAKMVAQEKTHVRARMHVKAKTHAKAKMRVRAKMAAAAKKTSNKTNKPFLGYGLGLRPEHYKTILDTKPKVDWFEILSENYMIEGGRALYYLDLFAERYPLVMHGVSMSIGSTDPINTNYLKKLKKLADRISPKWISDHLCWGTQGGHNVHDLMPLPYTKEAIDHLVGRIKQVQDFLGRQILLENVSSYVTYKQSEMTEWEFFAAVAKEADCLMLLDINNVYVSAVNHDFDPMEYVSSLDSKRIWQLHMAGYTDNKTHIIDTHDNEISDPVWDLYKKFVDKFGEVSAMIERDDNMPPFEDTMAELLKLREIGQIHGKS